MNSGELIVNGGMELFTGNVPKGWATTTPGLTSLESQLGHVHSGESSVALTNGAVLFQTVPVNGGCYYELSFFAHGAGAQVGFTATVNFSPSSGSGEALVITVRQQDLPNSSRIFSYFRGITTLAPPDATLAEIRFTVTSAGNQHLDLDDVSFTVS
jgi:hypothetical protein